MSRQYVRSDGSIVNETGSRQYVGSDGSVLSETSGSAGSITIAAAWTEGSEVIVATGAVAGGGPAPVTAAAAWTEGSETVAASGAASAPGVGTLTTLPLKNNTGTLLASETGITINIYNQTTGALIVQKTGATTDASGIATVTDALIVAGTTYAYEPVLTGGRRRLPVKAAT